VPYPCGRAWSWSAPLPVTTSRHPGAADDITREHLDSATRIRSCHRQCQSTPLRCRPGNRRQREATLRCRAGPPPSRPVVPAQQSRTRPAAAADAQAHRARQLVDRANCPCHGEHEELPPSAVGDYLPPAQGRRGRLHRTCAAVHATPAATPHTNRGTCRAPGIRAISARMPHRPHRHRSMPRAERYGRVNAELAACSSRSAALAGNRSSTMAGTRIEPAGEVWKAR
jgi:hypothetical protein